MVSTVFVSCEDSGQSAPLVAALDARGGRVVHSPVPVNDAHWAGWYADGCRAAMAGCDTFVAVVTAGFDGSTWMAHEADTAVRLYRGTGRPRPFLVRLCARPLPRGFEPLQQVARELQGGLEHAAERLLDDK